MVVPTWFFQLSFIIVRRIVQSLDRVFCIGLEVKGRSAQSFEHCCGFVMRTRGWFVDFQRQGDPPARGAEQGHDEGRVPDELVQVRQTHPADYTATRRYFCAAEVTTSCHGSCLNCP